MIRNLFLAVCLLGLAACHDPPPTPAACPEPAAVHEDAATLPVALTADVTISVLQLPAAVWGHGPAVLSRAVPEVHQRVPQPFAPRVILPHPAAVDGHARNASGRFTNADC